jgi:hypothetical protein
MKRKKDFVVVDLVGGLGNQLFGLAFGSALSDKLRCNLILDKSLIQFGSNHERKLEIQKFNFGLKNFKIKQSKLVKLFAFTKIEIFKKISAKIIITRRKTIKEENLEVKQVEISERYSGYFQDWMYADYLLFNNCQFSPNLTEDYLTGNILYKEFSDMKPVLVHIRLGDYLKFSNVYEVLPERYYLRAIEKLIEHDKTKEIWLVIEDFEQVTNYYPNLVKVTSKIIDKNLDLKDHEVFYLLSKSKFLITSNSTFSLWAAWFVLNDGGKVIVPSVFKVSGVPSKLIDHRWDAIDIYDFTFKPKRELELIRAENLVRFNNLFL